MLYFIETLFKFFYPFKHRRRCGPACMIARIHRSFQLDNIFNISSKILYKIPDILLMSGCPILFYFLSTISDYFPHNLMRPAKGHAFSCQIFGYIGGCGKSSLSRKKHFSGIKLRMLNHFRKYLQTIFYGVNGIK